MRTFKLLLAGAVLALAGCGEGFELGGVTRAAPDQIRLSHGTVVAGAEGWCIDRATSRESEETAVVVLGSCAAISDDAAAPRPDVPGVFTVSVESRAAVAPPPEALARFFETDAGRSALAHSGTAGNVEVLESQIKGDLLYIRVVDRSAAPGTDPEVWRALFDLEGHFTSVSLIGPADQPIDRDAGLATLAEQVRELRNVN